MANWLHIGKSSYVTVAPEASATVTVPAATLAGDLVVIVVGAESNGAPLGSSYTMQISGFTRAVIGGNLTEFVNRPVGAMFYAIAGAAVAAGMNKVVSSPGKPNSAWNVVCLVYRGINQGNPLDVADFKNGALGFTMDTPDGMSPVEPNELAVAGFLVMDDIGKTWIADAALMERNDAIAVGTIAPNLGVLSMMVADLIAGVPIGVAHYTSTMSSGNHTMVGFLGLFKWNPAPTVSLSAVDNFDKSVAQNWVYTFNDEMSGDFQTALQWRIYKVTDGSLVYDSGKVVTLIGTHVLPANTLVNGFQYQRQVRAWDSVDNVSLYSQLQSFYVAVAPSAVITSPVTNGEMIIRSFHRITWDFLNGEGGSQTAFQIIATKVSDATVFVNTGKVLTIDQFYDIISLSSEETYNVELYVWNARGVRSLVAALRSFVVNFAEPPTPILSIDNEGHYLQVVIANPGPIGGQLITSYNDLYRREVGGNWIRIAKELAINVIYEDRATSHEVEYEYKVIAFTGVGGTAEAGPTTPEAVIFAVTTWIHDPTNGAVTEMGFDQKTLTRSQSNTKEVHLLQFQGRTDPVAEFGTAEERTVSLDVYMLTVAEIRRLEILFDRNATLCYRDNIGRKIFGVNYEWTHTELDRGGRIPIVLTKVDYAEEV